uniref:Uncharacterized protein n=1 Tax=Sphaerodactylus townsendi TaxID=933632 RepID=A0ACB8F536_9SAUR
MVNMQLNHKVWLPLRQTWQLDFVQLTLPFYTHAHNPKLMTTLASFALHTSIFSIPEYINQHMNLSVEWLEIIYKTTINILETGWHGFLSPSVATSRLAESDLPSQIY